jgi:hypothetical protein
MLVCGEAKAHHAPTVTGQGLVPPKTELAAGVNSGENEMPCGVDGRTGRKSKLPPVFSA